MTKVIRAISSVPTTATAIRYPAPSLSHGAGADLTDADSLLVFMSHQSPYRCRPCRFLHAMLRNQRTRWLPLSPSSAETARLCFWLHPHAQLFSLNFGVTGAHWAATAA